MRVFLDANILFSAARNPGAVRDMLQRLHEAGHTLCMDQYVIEEACRNLAAKSSAHEHDLQRLLDNIEISPYQPASPGAITTRLLPEKDRPVLEAAIRLRCDVLVTGDKRHFGRLYGTHVENVAIHAPASLADLLAL